MYLDWTSIKTKILTNSKEQIDVSSGSKSLSWLRNSRPFMESEVPLPSGQEPATEPDEFSAASQCDTLLSD
jgi:hypothetical protein